MPKKAWVPKNVDSAKSSSLSHTQGPKEMLLGQKKRFPPLTSCWEGRDSAAPDSIEDHKKISKKRFSSARLQSAEHMEFKQNAFKCSQKKSGTPKDIQIPEKSASVKKILAPTKSASQIEGGVLMQSAPKILKNLSQMRNSRHRGRRPLRIFKVG